METATTAEKRPNSPAQETADVSPVKKQKVVDARDANYGVAPIKPEYVIERRPNAVVAPAVDDDAAEASRHTENNTAAVAEARNDRGRDRGGRGRKNKKNKGQNKARTFHFARDAVDLCQSLYKVDRESLFASTPCEFAENGRDRQNGGKGGQNRGKKNDSEANKEVDGEAKEGEAAEDKSKAKDAPKCPREHDLRAYLKAKRADSENVCPIFGSRGYCASGWKCRWVESHSKEEDGELMLVVDEEKRKAYEDKAAEQRRLKRENTKFYVLEDKPQEWETHVPSGGFHDPYGEIVNNLPSDFKFQLRKNKIPFNKTTVFTDWLTYSATEETKKEEHRAAYIEPPLRAEEKRKIYIGKETPLLAPLTTTGNLPFRRVCSDFGAALTYSEMAMVGPLLQGSASEWTLMRAHTSELPTFGAQICANKHEIAMRATEALTTAFPTAGSGRHGLALIDLNCGCPIDLVYETGAGSALLEYHGRLSKILKGMNFVSGSTPITVKIRMGCKDNKPTADKVVRRVFEGGDVQAITLHGRSRQQRYTRAADWGYIASISSLIKKLKQEQSDATDTAASKEGREKLPLYFVGNGDCYSHVDYYNSLSNSTADGIMLARGALIKPWVFEEIEKGQYLDKSSSQRLDMVRDYCRYGLENWGSDELGVATTRRFLLEWLSFTSRYVPIGILETLPPRIQDRPPPFKGRDEMETLLASGNVKDWIKISEMFLGKCPEDFFFTPKHKSNAYDAEAEG